MALKSKHFAVIFTSGLLAFPSASLVRADPQGERAFPTALSGALPYDVNIPRVRALVDQGDVGAAHAEFAILAWQAFIALNWPADADGKPSASQTIAETQAPRVWETFRPADTIFLAEGAAPQPWTGAPQVSSDYYWKSAWRQHTDASSNTEAFSGPLVDQNGHWVRYQMRVNHEEFDYIVRNTLYSQDGQVAFSQKDHDNQVELPPNDGEKAHGAIEIKLAWKELGPGDDPARFFTRWVTAQVSEPPLPDGKPAPPRRFLAGLVGMHISMKTRSSPEWIWSTFEQVDNVRQNTDSHGRPTHPNFFNPHQPQPINVLAPANAVKDPVTGVLTIVTATTPTPTNWVESLTRTPVQVQRVVVPTQPGLNPLDAGLGKVTQAINAQVQQLLAANKSVFQYYELIDVQWPEHPDAPAMAGGQGSAPESLTHKTPGDMIPVFLVNTTMETYFQKGPQPAGALEQDDRLAPGSPTIDTTMVNGTESCVGCHYSSGVAVGFKRDIATGKVIVDSAGYRTPVFGENNHFGKTGNASFSWMLQLEPKPKPVPTTSPDVVVAGTGH